LVSHLQGLVALDRLFIFGFKVPGQLFFSFLNALCSDFMVPVALL